MAGSRQNVAETIAELLVWRPVLAPVLHTFLPVLVAQAELVAELASAQANCAGQANTHAKSAGQESTHPACSDLGSTHAEYVELANAHAACAGLVLPEFLAARAGQGVSLLAEHNMAGTAGAIRISAAKLLPLLAKIEAVAPHLLALNAFFLKPVQQEAENANKAVDAREVLADALISGNNQALERIAKENDLDPSMLHFVAGFVLSAVLRAMVTVTLALSEEGQGAWNEGDAWQFGYCPVCGALPSMGWLDKPLVDEKNAFLAGGGGKKHLHCGQCGADWRFRRSACPACGEEGSGVLEILRESGIAHGERLDWCTKCKSYCPAVDLREREFIPNLDAAALGMLHLDMVAARKDLRPLRPSFWNMF